MILGLSRIADIYVHIYWLPKLSRFTEKEFLEQDKHTKCKIRK